MNVNHFSLQKIHLAPSSSMHHYSNPIHHLNIILYQSYLCNPEVNLKYVSFSFPVLTFPPKLYLFFYLLFFHFFQATVMLAVIFQCITWWANHLVHIWLKLIKSIHAEDRCHGTFACCLHISYPTITDNFQHIAGNHNKRLSRKLFNPKVSWEKCER